MNANVFNQWPGFDDFVKGQQDCRDGIPHVEGKSREYTAGYNFEYQNSAILDQRTEVRHGLSNTNHR